MDKLQKVQNFTGRIDLGLRKYDDIPEGLKSLNWLPMKDRLKLNDATMFSNAFIILLLITLQISLGYVFVFMTGKLDQLIPWIYLFAAFQLVRGLLLIEKRNCGTH